MPNKPQDWRPFNINRRVRVRLTEVGKRVWLDYWALASQAVDAAWAADAIKDGWLTTQLWQIMNVFGECTYLGCDIPFGTEIFLEPE